MNEKLTNKQRREQAREQARLAREAEKKREKRNRLLLQGGIALGVVAILGIVALVLTQTMKPAGPGPANMASGGVTIGQDFKVVETAALESGEQREARDVDWTQGPVDLTLYVDYMCTHCGTFEQTYGDMLASYVDSGDITLTIYPVNMLDGSSLGTKYSTRAGNIIGCVAEQQPDVTFALHNLLLSAAVQPAQSTTGLSDDQLIEQAVAAGASKTTELTQCVKQQHFAGFIAANYKSATELGIVGLAEGAQLMNPSTGELVPLDQPQRLMSTPTLIVNGQQWVSTRDGELQPYLEKLISQLNSNGATEEEGTE